jgi:PAS domain-containing protein
MTEVEEQPLELILARNLISIISLGAMLVDTEGAIVFYNDAAAEVLGARFEETGRIPQKSWRTEIGPFDEHGRRLPTKVLPVTVALRDARPGYGRFHVRSANAGLIPVEVAALPLIGSAGHHGALVVFWPLDADRAWPLEGRQV